MSDRPKASQLLRAIQAIRTKDGALDDVVVPMATDSVVEPEPEPSPEPQGLLPWLTALGMAQHEETVGNYVSESTELADLRGMLVSEQEDEEEEDLKDLIKDMELEDDEALRFREAIAVIVLAPSPKEQAEAAAETAAEAAAVNKAEAEKDIKTNRIWLALAAELELETAGTELEQAKAKIAEKDEVIEQHEETLAQERADKDKERAEKEQALVEKDEALATLAAQAAELERLRAQVAEGRIVRGTMRGMVGGVLRTT
eukprot:COSAG04_NODE_733_length_10713_cov_8.864236_1_plen_257_part_10